MILGNEQILAKSQNWVQALLDAPPLLEQNKKIGSGVRKLNKINHLTFHKRRTLLDFVNQPQNILWKIIYLRKNKPFFDSSRPLVQTFAINIDV